MTLDGRSFMLSLRRVSKVLNYVLQGRSWKRTNLSISHINGSPNEPSSSHTVPTRMKTGSCCTILRPLAGVATRDVNDNAVENPREKKMAPTTAHANCSNNLCTLTPFSESKFFYRETALAAKKRQTTILL